MRLNERSSTSPSVRTSSVLPSPGTPSSSTCPPANSAISVPSTTESWPTITLPSSARNAEWAWRKVWICSSVFISSLLQVVKIVLYRPLVGAGDLFLAQGALGVGLRGGGRFLIGHLALAFDAHAFQGNARHLAAGLELASHLRGLERVAQLALAPVGVAARILVGPVNARIVPVVTPLAVPLSVGIAPGADASARMVAIGIVARLVAGAHAPTLTRADAHRGLVQALERRRQLLRIAHRLRQVTQFLGRRRQRLRRARFVP